MKALQLFIQFLFLLVHVEAKKSKSKSNDDNDGSSSRSSSSSSKSSTTTINTPVSDLLLPYDFIFGFSTGHVGTTALNEGKQKHHYLIITCYPFVLSTTTFSYSHRIYSY